MKGVSIREARRGDELAIGEFMALLWPEGAVDEFQAETALLIRTGVYGTLTAVIFVAADEKDLPVGFLQVGLRSHADGCDTSHPVGFIEGWFVGAGWRGKGIGRELVQAAEAWSRGKGCSDLASDALLENADSLHAHSALGFEVVDRCVHLRKKL
jgi:aminoglycoside 6'-N-acetyltransferase I